MKVEVLLQSVLQSFKDPDVSKWLILHELCNLPGTCKCCAQTHGDFPKCTVIRFAIVGFGLQSRPV